MRIIRSLSASAICNSAREGTMIYENIFYRSLYMSLSSLVSQTITKSRVFVRLIFNRNTTANGISVKETLGKSVRLSPVDGARQQTAQTAVNGIKRSASRELFRRITLRWINASLNANLRKNTTLLGGGGLSLGLVGVCVKKNGKPTLLTEMDEMEVVCQEIRSIFDRHDFSRKFIDPKLFSLDNLDIGSCIAKGCNAAVYEAKLKNGDQRPLAVKMMFNYDAESNAGAVISAMSKECVPFSGRFSVDDQLADLLQKRRRRIGSHPNIVEIYGIFADFTPCLEDSFSLYPAALPTRINEFGLGRNMTMFLVMKRYDTSLKQYLLKQTPDSATSLSMLTQLFEAVAFLNKSKIAHRDLKCDNILVELANGEPWIVVTDFGSCLEGLSLPFATEEVYRGGNRALMAPEVVTAQAGSFSSIDYSASDLWAVGAISYELFCGQNPFYSYPNQKTPLQSSTYDDSSLPDMPESMPQPIQLLVDKILKRKPCQRPEPRIAATICHIILHSTSKSLESVLEKNTNAKKLLKWLAEVTMTTIGERNENGNAISQVEMRLRRMFLSQAKVEHLVKAVEIIS